MATITEHLRHGKLTGVSARNRTKAVVIASASATLTAGAIEKLELVLNTDRTGASEALQIAHHNRHRDIRGPDDQDCDLPHPRAPEAPPELTPAGRSAPVSRLLSMP